MIRRFIAPSCAVAFFVASLVGACSGVKSPAADNYRFERKEFTNVAPAPTFVVHPSQTALVAAAPANIRKSVEGSGRSLMAWSILKAKGGCEVHIIDPAVKYAPEWIGHEVTHCVYGRWHA